MEQREHAQFLEYLERFEYFRRPGVAKLDRASFLALVRELAALQRTDPHDPRIPALRRVLLRD